MEEKDGGNRKTRAMETEELDQAMRSDAEVTKATGKGHQKTLVALSSGNEMSL